jgi:hypothetical protein
MVLVYSNSVMLEIPSMAMAVVCCACIVARLEYDSKLLDFAIFPLASIAVLTKQQNIFLLPFMLSCLVSYRQWRLFTRGWMYLGLFVGILLLLPWLWVTATEGAIMVDEAMGIGQFRLWELSNWTYYAMRIPKSAGWPMTLFALAGIVASTFRRDRYNAAIHCWGASLYFTNSILALKADRYNIYLIAYLAYFAAYAIWLGWLYVKNSQITSVFIALSVIACIAPGWLSTYPRHPEYDAFVKAAEGIASNAPDDRPTVVLYDGFYDGVFVASIRAEHPTKPIIVVRGSKVLFATKFHTEWGTVELVKSEKDLRQVISDWGVQYIVIEREPKPDLAPSRMLRAVLSRGGSFSSILNIPSGGPTGDIQVFINSEQVVVPERSSLRFPALGSGRSETVALNWQLLWPPERN